jgi:hypothetical protein
MEPVLCTDLPNASVGDGVSRWFSSWFGMTPFGMVRELDPIGFLRGACSELNFMP